jgi:hypothetical protein
MLQTPSIGCAVVRDRLESKMRKGHTDQKRPCIVHASDAHVSSRFATSPFKSTIDWPCTALSCTVQVVSVMTAAFSSDHSLASACGHLTNNGI